MLTRAANGVEGESSGWHLKWKGVSRPYRDAHWPNLAHRLFVWDQCAKNAFYIFLLIDFREQGQGEEEKEKERARETGLLPHLLTHSLVDPGVGPDRTPNLHSCCLPSGRRSNQLHYLARAIFYFFKNSWGKIKKVKLHKTQM